MSKINDINNLQVEVVNGDVKVVEIGWLEVEVIFEDRSYVLEFETTEQAMSRGNVFTVEFYDKDSIKLAKQIGFEITEDFKTELYKQWGKYSNKTFR
jgi:hypothetical protein